MAQNQENLDILDTEFQINLQLASNYMKQMMLSEDRRVCHKYIRNCLNMRNTDQVKVKMHRNRFFNFLLKTMKRTVENQKHSVFINVSQNAFLDPEKGNETKQWSADRKSYVSMKVIPGFGTLIYMACTDKPELGWDENGFANFTDLSKVPNFPSKQEEPGQHPAAPPAGQGQVPPARLSQISQAVPVVVSTPQVQFNVSAASP